MEIIWDQLCKSDWQARVAGQAQAALRQDWDFGVAMARLGGQIGRAVVQDRGRMVAMAQVLERRGLRVIGQGPLWLAPLEPGQKRGVIRQLARHAGGTILTPNEAVAGWGLVPLITPRSSALWCIDRPVAGLRQGLHGKWRNRLVVAERLVRPVPLNQQELRDLIAQEAAQRQVRGYQNLPGALAEAWPGLRIAFGWRAEGALQAGMVFLIHGWGASYYLGWASAMARKVFAHGPILWQAALALRDKGVRMLDLGEVNTDTGAGLARFKLGTGARVVAAGASCLVLP